MTRHGKDSKKSLSGLTWFLRAFGPNRTYLCKIILHITLKTTQFRCISIQEVSIPHQNNSPTSKYTLQGDIDFFTKDVSLA